MNELLFKVFVKIAKVAKMSQYIISTLKFMVSLMILEWIVRVAIQKRVCLLNSNARLLSDLASSSLTLFRALLLITDLDKVAIASAFIESRWLSNCISCSFSDNFPLII